jgi:hypothetical protein
MDQEVGVTMIISSAMLYVKGLSLVNKLLATVVVIAGLFTGIVVWKKSIYNEGYRAGEAHVTEQWKSAIAAEQAAGDEALAGARIDVKRSGPGGMRDDSWNRDVEPEAD